jgi:hypothetical protein
MANRSHDAEFKTRRELKRAATVGLALFAAGLVALIYLRTL